MGSTMSIGRELENPTNDRLMMNQNAANKCHIHRTNIYLTLNLEHRVIMNLKVYYLNSRT